MARPPCSMNSPAVPSTLATGGIYSLSPYTLEETVTRKYLINEKPDVILNIIDGTNLERNLYLTTQLIEVGLPVVIARHHQPAETVCGNRSPGLSHQRPGRQRLP